MKQSQAYSVVTYFSVSFEIRKGIMFQAQQLAAMLNFYNL